MVAANHKGIYHGLALHKFHRTGGEACQRQLGMGTGVIEHSIHPVGKIERYILIGSAVVHALSVLILQIEGLSAEVHLCKAFAGTGKAFVGLALKRKGGTVNYIACFAIAQGERIIAGRREMVVGSQPHLALAVGIEAQIEGLLRVGKQGAPTVQRRLLHIDEGTHHPLFIGDAPPLLHLFHMQGHPFHPFTILQHLVAVGGQHAFGAVEGHKHTDYLGLILADHQRMLFKFGRDIGRHIVGILLFLKGNGHPYIAIMFRYGSGLVCLPQRLLPRQVFIKVEEVKEIIVCGYHCMDCCDLNVYQD